MASIIMSGGGLAEADGVLLHALRRLGACPPDTADGCASLAADDVIAIAQACVRLADGQSEVTPSPPPDNPGARFQLCARLAADVTRLGFRAEGNADVGFAAFLYPNETSTRALLSFLLGAATAAAGKSASHEEEDDHGAGGSGSEKTGTDAGSAKTSAARRRAVRNALSAALRQGSGTQASAACENARPFWSVSTTAKEGDSTGSVGIAPFVCDILNAKATHRDQRTLRQIRQQPLLLVPSALRQNARALAAEEQARKERRARTTAASGASGAHATSICDDVRQALRAHAGGGAGSMAHTRRTTGNVLKKDRRAPAAGLFASLAMFDDRSAFDDDDEEDSKTKAAAEKDASKDAVLPAIETAEMRAAKRQEELRALQSQLAAIGDEARDAGDAINRLESARVAAIELEAGLQRGVESVRADLETLKETFGVSEEDMDAAGGVSLAACRENLLKRRREIERKFAKLEDKFEAAAAPLREEIDAQRSDADAKRAASSDRVSQLHELRREVKETLVTAREREAEKHALAQEVSKMRPDEPTRESYVVRILEIIRNVKKQENEIARIIEDTREVQRSMNTSVEALKRSHAITDDIIFRDASKGGEDAKKAYRFSVEIHKSFESLGIITSDRGRLSKEAYALEAQVADLESQVDEDNLKQVTSELERIRLEKQTAAQASAAASSSIKV